ncbi:hypothetical protein Tco_0692157 [Tanacetum coccineum]
MDNSPRDNHTQQPPYKRQNVARAYTVGTSEKREYAETIHVCNKCKLHYNGPCTAKCGNCKKVRHLARDCREIVFKTCDPKHAVTPTNLCHLDTTLHRPAAADNNVDTVAAHILVSHKLPVVDLHSG